MEKYYRYLLNIVASPEERRDYSELFRVLFNTEFIPILPLDENRRADGIDFRETYIWDTQTEDLSAIESGDPCSILEMMIALAYRIEQSIMGDPEYGDRTAEWFWRMLDNLGIGEQTNANFDEAYVERILDDFNHRRYRANGEGSLFIVNQPINMRNVEIWSQMQLYFNELLSMEGEYI